MAIVVDTSAFAAIFQGDAGSEELMHIFAGSYVALVPASCLVEASLLRRLGADFFPWLETSIDDGFELVPITARAGRIAAQAARSNGRGSGHPAKLNFGDCLSFGVAGDRGLPLLFAGDDFRETPIQAALQNPI